MKKSRFQRNPQRGPNIHIQTLQTQCFQTVLWKERLNSVSGVHSSESSFSEWFTLVFIRRYFLYYSWPQSAWNVHLQIPEKEGFKSTLSTGRFNSLSWTHATQRSCWEFFCLALDKEIQFPTKSSKRSKYPHADFTNTVFPNCSMKRKVKLCEWNAHITNWFLKLIHSSFSTKIFPSLPLAPKRLKCPLANSTKRGFQMCFV